MRATYFNLFSAIFGKQIKSGPDCSNFIMLLVDNTLHIKSIVCKNSAIFFAKKKNAQIFCKNYYHLMVL